MRILLESCYLNYVTSSKSLTVGAWSMFFDTDCCEVRIGLHVDKDRYKQLSEFGLNPSENDLITSTFIHEWYQVYKPYPEFIRQRTFSPKRCDEPWKAEPWCLERYENFHFLCIYGGQHLDNWLVSDDPLNDVDLPCFDFDKYGSFAEEKRSKTEGN